MQEQDERKKQVELVGVKAEQVMDIPGYFELQKEGMGWRGKHALQAEGKTWVDLRQVEKKVQKTERKEARELSGWSLKMGGCCCCCCFLEGCTKTCWTPLSLHLDLMDGV